MDGDRTFQGLFNIPRFLKTGRWAADNRERLVRFVDNWGYAYTRLVHGGGLGFLDLDIE